MLEPQTIALIQGIIAGKKCSCGLRADRFRKIGQHTEIFYCHSCYFNSLSQEEDDSILVYRSILPESEIEDTDNMPDLYWVAPQQKRRRYPNPRRYRRSKKMA